MLCHSVAFRMRNMRPNQRAEGGSKRDVGWGIRWRRLLTPLGLPLPLTIEASRIDVMGIRVWEDSQLMTNIHIWLTDNESGSRGRAFICALCCFPFFGLVIALACHLAAASATCQLPSHHSSPATRPLSHSGSQAVSQAVQQPARRPPS